MNKLIIALYSFAVLTACTSSENAKEFAEHSSLAVTTEVDSFLTIYNSEYQKYLIASAEGQWLLNTHIVEGDTVTEKLAAKADEEMAAYTGKKEIIGYYL